MADPLQAELLEALKRRLAVIGDPALRQGEPSAHLEQIKQASERITALEARLPRNIHPQLRHFFERCSYDKALAWIEEQGL